MKRLTNIKLFNSPLIDKSMSIEWPLNKDFLIITGYNGSGKSRTVAHIFETLAALRDTEIGLVPIGWASELTFEDTSVRCIKRDYNGERKSNLRDLVMEVIHDAADIDDMYRDIAKILEHSRHYPGIKTKETGVTKGFACLGVNAKTDEDRESFVSGCEAVSFIEEKIYFSFNREVSESVFDGPERINQTLYSLFYEFVLAQVGQGNARDKVFSLFMEYKNSVKDFDEAGARAYVASKFDPEAMFANESFFESSEVFQELNKFYDLTGRKLIWREKHAALQFPDGRTVPWVLFSKGEKAIVAILLMAYLYKDQSLFIFDEPDLSLHMEWQKMLLPALKRLAPNSQFIITTHSPFMVMNTDSEHVINMAKIQKEAFDDQR
ncbi:AAA family ATPase [Pseudomonas fragi]|uniref:AAA family ATPase n=1 Tax=Pseudomonas fragi TaxID=296 RepID=UPI001F4675E0|nr:ATP-binding protein [Pseudomonas fragi]MCF6763810.1 ATP-binding protein [Pseudomonas fragi]